MIHVSTGETKNCIIPPVAAADWSSRAYNMCIASFFIVFQHNSADRVL